jgi:hypothetical protein
MLTQEQINKIRIDSGLQPVNKPVTNNVFNLTGLAPERKKRNFTGKYDYLLEQPEENLTGLKEMGQDISQTGQALKRTVGETKDKIQDIATAKVEGKQGGLRSFGQTFGTIAGGVSRGIGDVLMGAVKSVLPQAKEEDVKEGLANMIEKAAPVASKIDKALGQPVGTLLENYQNLPEQSKRDVDALFGFGEFALDLAGAGLTKKVGKKGVKTGITAGKRVAEGTAEQGRRLVGAGEDALTKGKKAIGDVNTKIPELISPQPKPLEAVGQVLQGKTKDVSAGVKGLSTLETTGIKTFKELEGKVSDRIKSLSRQVDTDLASNPIPRNLDDLKTVSKTSAGTKVTSNPVKRAFTQLEELYGKTGDDLSLAQLQETITKAKKSGLTDLEINKLAREYGSEFGQKAFSKVSGEPLTSVNAQLYENTRTALKDLARNSIKGDAAKKADELVSNLYRTRDLVRKSVEGVAKLQNKIRDRGLFEKAGYYISKYADILTGGTIRGVVGGILPRGAGYKTLNALDLEKYLQKNLEIIQKATKSGSDKEIINILKGLDRPLPKAKGVTPKTTSLVSNKSLLGGERDFAKLSPQNKAIESRAFNRVDNNAEEILQDYFSKKGKVVNTDEFRKYFIDDGYNGANAASVQEPASELGKKAFIEALQNEGKYATMFAGGSGAGKTSAIKQIDSLKGLMDDSAAILDGNLSKYSSAIKRIKEANNAGKKVPIIYVYREPVDSMINGVVKRSLNNADEAGRIVPTKITADNHIGSWETVNKLSKEGKVDVFVIDNSLGAKNAKITTLNKLRDKVNYQSVEKLTKKFNNEIKKLYEEGTITKEQYKNYIK